MSTSNNSVIVDVQKLNKNFGDVRAVKDLTFQVQQGEVFGFLGPNGAGKTTTMRIITCFIPASEGKVLINGLNTQEHSYRIREKLGYLPENAPLYNDMIVNEYLAFVGKLHGLSGSALSSAVDRMYQVCGLTTMTNRQIGKLSKGYRQRVGLAQAMIHNPDLLILDEPMSGLDPNQIIEIRELIKKIGKEKTVIYCSHILSEVSATCSKILIINNGSIVATGTPKELTSQSGKGTVYRMKVKGDKNLIRERIAQLGGVSNAVVESSAGDWAHLLVNTGTDSDLGETLFRCVVDNGWSLAELKQETTSLEEIFTQLTRG